MNFVLAPNYKHFLTEFRDYKRKAPNEPISLCEPNEKEHAIYLRHINDVRGIRMGSGDYLVLTTDWKLNPNYDRQFIDALLPTLDKLNRDFLITALKTNQ